MKDEKGKDALIWYGLLLMIGLMGMTSAAVAVELPAQTQMARGKHIYAMQCVGCHGEDGEATFRGDNVKTLPGIHIRRNDFEIGHRFRGFMAALFTEEERADLVTYVKSFKGRKGYERPEFLIDATALMPFVTDPGVRIVDLRDEANYAVSHLPNAVHLDAAKLDPLPGPEAFARLMAMIGVGDDTYVAAYDDDGGRSASLLWAALQEYGHARVSVLDGGWRVWTAQGRYVTEWKPSKRAVTFTPRPRTYGCIVDAPVRTKRTVVVDASGQPSFSHASLSVPWVRSLQIDGTLWPAAPLNALYRNAGVTPDRFVYTTAQSASEAAQTLFVLRLSGYPDVRMAMPPRTGKLSFRE